MLTGLLRTAAFLVQSCGICGSSPTGFQSLLFLGSVPLLFREKLAVGRFASDSMVLCWGRVYGEGVFQTFLLSFANV